MLPDGTIESFGLMLMRTSALVLSAPLLGLASGFSGYKVALILVLTLVLYALVGEPIAAAGPIELTAMALRELLIGFFLGFVTQMLVLAAQVGGELVGTDMGFAMAAQIDPETGVNTKVVAKAYETFLLLALLAVDGHLWIVSGLEQSFHFAPVGALAAPSSLAALALDVFVEMFAAGITLAAPVLLLLVLATVLLGLLARMVPQLNVFDLSFQLRIGIGFFGMLLCAPLLAPAFTRLMELAQRQLTGALSALGAS